MPGILLNVKGVGARNDSEDPKSGFRKYFTCIWTFENSKLLCKILVTLPPKMFPYCLISSQKLPYFVKVGKG